MSNIDTVIEYHDRSKHHFDRYARSAGHLDWASQPGPYRRYLGVKTTRLPLQTPATPGLFDPLYEAHGNAPAPINLSSLSDFLRNSLAISAWKQRAKTGGPCGSIRPADACIPLKPTSLSPDGRGISDHPVLLHYQPRTHVLEHRAAFHPELWRRLLPGVGDGSFLIGLSSICWREAWKYGERAFRYCQHDVGHALAALRFSAAILGWKLEVIPGISSASLAELLGLSRDAEFDPEESEEPELLALVSTTNDSSLRESVADPDEDARRQIRESDWFGRPNQLSREHVAWEANDAVAAATRQPSGTNICTPLMRDPDAAIDRFTLETPAASGRQ